jgi:hypothetical protein
MIDDTKHSDRKIYEKELKHENENDDIKNKESNKQKNIIVVIRKNKSKVDIKNCS